jgi:hypothetical protein
MSCRAGRTHSRLAQPQPPPCQRPRSFAGRIDETVARMATIMHDTSVVLFGEPMFIDCGKPVHGPDRFIPEEPSAQVMWALLRTE